MSKTTEQTKLLFDEAHRLLRRASGILERAYEAHLVELGRDEISLSDLEFPDAET